MNVPRQKKAAYPQSWGVDKTSDASQRDKAGHSQSKGSGQSAMSATNQVPNLKPVRVIGNGAFGKSNCLVQTQRMC